MSGCTGCGAELPEVAYCISVSLPRRPADTGHRWRTCAIVCGLACAARVLAGMAAEARRREERQEREAAGLGSLMSGRPRGTR
jgi:hypothetical protein